MYRWEKSLRELEKSRKNPKNPSFSSSLLDEIYRSIDGNDEKSAEELRVYGERNVKNDDNKYVMSNYCRSGNNGGGAGVLLRTKVEKEEEKEEVASLKTRASLIEKWMDKKVISADNVCSRRSRRPCSSSLPEIDNSYIIKSSSSLLTQDNDPLFFSSSSISSDSSSGGLSSSSSDTEFFSSSSSSSTSTSLMSNKTSRKSCFTTAGAAPWPKPVRTSISRQQQQQPGYEYNTVDDHQNNRQKTKDQETLIKSKNRAMKIYANLKNVKQPISPGARLTSFINSLFTHGNTKKSNNTNSEKGRGGGYEDSHSERKSKSTQASSTSYSSFSRSCLSKTPPLHPPPQPRVEEKLSDSSSGSTKRTVRFYPVSVIVGEDCRPCGHKCIYDAAETIKREQKSNQIQNSSKNSNEGSTTFTVERIISHPEEEEEEEEDYDDGCSDSSSDLFEIDHLSLFNNDRFREELPVYETTHLDRNLAIASGLIR